MSLRIWLSIGMVAVLLLTVHCGDSNKSAKVPQFHFDANSASLMNYQVPQWYEDAKFGIYFHWAPFSVPAYKTEWYPHWMYSPAGIEKRPNFQDIPKHHVEAWGPLDKFGYKDFIPMFKAEKWNPQEWVELFKEAGAKYVVSAAVHHDGFALWDSKHIPYNAKVMGPKRDIVGEFTAAAREAGLKTGVATHYGRHWAYYTFRPEYDTWDPQYEGLYGHRRNENDPPRPEDERHWQNVMTELIDNYQPDYIYVDGGIGDGERRFKKPYFRQAFYNVLAHYYNSAQQRGAGVVLTYKRQFLDPNQAVEDFERSGMDHIRLSSKWQTDDKISVNGWCYVEDTGFWPVDYFIGALADIVSKNGNLLLSIGPKPDGTLRTMEVITLRAIGKWLAVNGEAIFGTRPWRQYGEGSTVAISADGARGKEKMGPDAVRFTVKDNVLYAICFGWPDFGEFTIKSLGASTPVSKRGIKSITMLGSDEEVEWEETQDGLNLIFPTQAPCEYAYVLKIVPKGDLNFEFRIENLE